MRGIDFRFFDRIETEALITVLKAFDNHRVRTIHIYIKYVENIKEYLDLIAKYSKKVTKVPIHSSPKNEYIHRNENLIITILHTLDNLYSEECCGKISPIYFSSNVHLYTESIHFNNWLNGKICVDKSGEIKNCPSTKISFGNIRDNSMIKIANEKSFQNL